MTIVLGIVVGVAVLVGLGLVGLVLYVDSFKRWE